MTRKRLGVALVIDPPVADEIDGLRRALRDPTLGRMAPHLTLVPPVNVRAEELRTALAVLREAAARGRAPLRLTLGGPATFLPANPVAYLPVGGDLDELRALRDAVFRGPLDRRLSWPWVPHVTIADGVDPPRIEAALSCLDGYFAVVDLDRVVLLEEAPGRSWVEVADADLGREGVVATGGLELRITRGRVADPEVLAMLGERAAAWPGDRSSALMVHTARREGGVVGVGAGWIDLEGAHVAVFVAEASRQEGVGTHLLRSLESDARRAGWAFPELAGEGPADFYESRSAWTRVSRTRPPHRGTAS